MRMKSRCGWLAMVVVMVTVMGAGQDRSVAQSEESVVIGVKETITSHVLNETRGYSVYVPRSYNETTQRYPLLVVLDGDDFFHFLTGAIDYDIKLGKIPEMIVVGIDSTDRMRDFTPTRAGIPGGQVIETSGGGDAFHRFLSEELMPTLEKKFRLSAFRVLCGHSLAGLFATDNVIHHPEEFSGVIATSPSLWWDNERTRRETDARLKRGMPLEGYLFVAVGGEGPTLEDPIDSFTRVLQKHPEAGITWTFRKFDGVDHQTMPLKSFVYGLEFIFGDWQMPASFNSEGLEAVEAYYRRLSLKYRQPVEIPEQVLNRLGYMELGKGQFDAAIRVFELNAQKYPHSANVYDSLGEAYLKKGDRERAILNYRKSLAINPQNPNARRVLGESQNK